MAKKSKSTGVLAAEVGAGLAAAAAAGAGYYFYGSDNAKKNRTAAMKWASEVEKRVESESKRGIARGKKVATRAGATAKVAAVKTIRTAAKTALKRTAKKARR